MINSNLSYLLSEYLADRLSNVAWIGIENDFNDNFLDLQEALQQVNYIQMNTDVIDMQFQAIQDSIIISQDIVTKIRIVKKVAVDLEET